MNSYFTKTKGERIHSTKRFLERFNINLTLEKRERIIRKIQNRHIEKEAILIEKQTNRISLYDVIVENQVVRIVYDKIRKEIVTALHPDLEMSE